MMVAIFALMSTALLAAFFGPRWLTAIVFVAVLVVSTGFFLYDVYNPEHGFAMPWIQVSNALPEGDA